MSNIFGNLCATLKKRKGWVCILILLTVVAICLGIVAALNFGEVFTIDLGNISYIKFLKGESGFFSLFLNLTLSLALFAFLIILFGCKSFLYPLSVVFYLYLVYSQAVIIVSIISFYGFFNCVVLVLFLLLFQLVAICLFLLLLVEILNSCNKCNYFGSCFNFASCNVSWLLITILILIMVFCIIITILKSFVLLLVFQTC